MVTPQAFLHLRNTWDLAHANRGGALAVKLAQEVLDIPHCSRWLEPVLAALPCQLLANHVAVGRGADVDQPPNLPKSVTVE